MRGAWGTGGRWWAEVMETRVMGARADPGLTRHSTRGLGQGPGNWDVLGSFFAFKKIIDLCHTHMENKLRQ